MNNTTYTVKEFILYILRKWWILVLAALLVAGLLGGPKLMENTGGENVTFSINSILLFENHKTNVDRNTSIEKYDDYSDLWFRDTSVSSFLSEIAGKYDMNMLSGGWSADDVTSQIDWFDEHMTCIPLANTPKYELQLTLPTTPENYEYVQDNAENFFRDFVGFATELCRVEAPELQESYLEYSFYEIPAASGTSVAKYLALGVVLGAVLGIFILGVMFLASRKIVSKNMLLNGFEVDSIDTAKQPDYDVFCYAAAQMKKSGKRAVVFTSTRGDFSLANSLLQQFADAGYTVSAVNLTGENLQVLGQLPAEDCKALTVPGKTQDAIEGLTQQADCLLIMTKTPQEDAVVSELLENSACGVFSEKLYVSNRNKMERSLLAVHNYAPATPVCIAWEK